MTGMNEAVRTAVAQALKEKDLTQKELAAQIGMEPPNVSRLLNGHSGRIPENWQRILDALDLQLVAVPRADSSALREHAEGVSAAVQSYGPLALLGLLHDLGKYSPTFQEHVVEIERELTAQAS